ncbi:unnamed protein product [Closterium sp. NIES-65]|nr:unnamed protein product [Closterium sp. NIES-65]
MLVLAIFILSAVAATPVPPITSAASNKYAFVPATNSLLFGNGYSVTWGATGITSAVDSHGAPLKAVKNPANGSVTVDGAYTTYPNGTLTGPGIVIVISGPTAGFSMGKTMFLKSETIVDTSRKPVVPNANADGSYTAGDLKWWSNGTIVGPTGASIYLSAPLTLNPDDTIGLVDPSSNYSYNPTANSLTFGNSYTVTWSETEKLTSAVDSTGGKFKGTNNRDGSSTIDGVYTAYGYGTLTGSGIVVFISGPTAGFTMGKTTFLKNATIVDASGTPVVSTANADWSYTAGDLTGWSNGTIVGPTGASIYLGAPLTLNSDGTVTFASNSGGSGSAPSAAPPAPSGSAPSATPSPPPPMAAGLLATPATTLTAVITLMLGSILFV